MRRNEIGVGARFQRDLEKVARVEAEDRPAVGGDVADTGEALGDAVGGGEIRRIDQVMNLPRLVALLVDRGNLHREHEAHRRAACRRYRLRDRLLDLGAQAEQAGLGRNELVLQLGAPDRMAKVAGADHGNTLARRPGRQMLEIEIAAGGARIFRVHVQVGVKAGHGRKATPRPDSAEKPAVDKLG
jgi:hypothetical protein